MQLLIWATAWLIRIWIESDEYPLWIGMLPNLSCVNKAWLKTQHRLNNEFKSSLKPIPNHVDSYASLTNCKIICCKRNPIPDYLFHTIASLYLTSSHQNRFPHMSVRAVSRRRQPWKHVFWAGGFPGWLQECSPLGRADISYGGEPTHKQLKMERWWERSCFKIPLQIVL